jgi:ribosomal protein S18 acetylase RimI-like enzyme
MTLRIAPMTRSQLGIALAWAAEEGWNPGLDDADAFHAADPGGFLMGWIDDTPVSCISVVRHDPGFAFLGLYLCRPDWRGRGHGWAVWQAGLAIAGDRTIGLDGVVDQQTNYRRSGFVSAGRTLRFAGDVAAGSSEGLRPASAMHKRVAALDRDATGIGRPAFLGAWLSDTPTRRSLCTAEGDDFAAFGTIRRCLSGAKVGPLFAREPADARRLLAALAGVFPDRPLILDVPETNAAAQALVADLGMEPVFETARMYRGTPPAQDPAVTWGVATLELG